MSLYSTTYLQGHYSNTCFVSALAEVCAQLSAIKIKLKLEGL